MTIYDKGLLRAMKEAYKGSGYYVALTEDGLLIQTAFWGVEIVEEAVPNSIKSLIVLHNGGLPRMNTAVCVQKAECGSAILETVCSTMDGLSRGYTTTGGVPIKPTRLTIDGMRVWQTTTDLAIRVVYVEDQQIIAGEKMDAVLVGGFIYARVWYGSVYIRPQLTEPEDLPLMEHLAQMQWISLDSED